jgi:hypothetical protein
MKYPSKVVPADLAGFMQHYRVCFAAEYVVGKDGLVVLH